MQSFHHSSNGRRLVAFERDVLAQTGVLQIEALAQTGGILAINTMPEGQYDTYFVKIDNCKFKLKVVPGDTMILKMELLNPIRRGLCEMRGTVYVGNKIATEADLMAQLVKR